MWADTGGRQPAAKTEDDASPREVATCALRITYYGAYRISSKREMQAASLSRGDKRRLEIGMCLSQNPRLLLLDEPTAGMARADTNNTIDLLNEIKQKRDITIAIIEHDMHVVFSLADRITVLAQGTPLVEDVPDKIKGHPKVKEAYLGETQ